MLSTTSSEYVSLKRLHDDDNNNDDNGKEGSTSRPKKKNSSPNRSFDVGKRSVQELGEGRYTYIVTPEDRLLLRLAHNHHIPPRSPVQLEGLLHPESQEACMNAAARGRGVPLPHPGMLQVGHSRAPQAPLLHVRGGGLTGLVPTSSGPFSILGPSTPAIQISRARPRENIDSDSSRYGTISDTIHNILSTSTRDRVTQQIDPSPTQVDRVCIDNDSVMNEPTPDYTYDCNHVIHHHYHHHYHPSNRFYSTSQASNWFRSEDDTALDVYNMNHSPISDNVPSPLTKNMSTDIETRSISDENDSTQQSCTNDQQPIISSESFCVQAGGWLPRATTVLLPLHNLCEAISFSVGCIDTKVSDSNDHSTDVDNTMDAAGPTAPFSPITSSSKKSKSKSKKRSNGVHTK